MLAKTSLKQWIDAGQPKWHSAKEEYNVMGTAIYVRGKRIIPLE
jgi:hypothetical protein